METIYLTAYEISEILKISYEKALDFIKYSGIPYVKIGRQYRVSEKAFYNYLNPPAPIEKKPLKRLAQHYIVT